MPASAKRCRKGLLQPARQPVGEVLIFFNAPYFTQQALAAIAAAGSDVKWFVLEALPMTHVDLRGYDALQNLSRILGERGAELVVAGRRTEAQKWRTATGLGERRVVGRHFPTLRRAVKAYREMPAAGSPGSDKRSEEGLARRCAPTRNLGSLLVESAPP